MPKNRNLIIIALIAVVNALGYGIIIPIIYSYSRKFGLNDFQNGLLFSLFSLCSFLSTPIIGRMSDKYGRKPLLVISLFGTAVSFFMAAFASNAIFLFIARALDGITAGNLPVASAVISDSTEIKDRAKGFAIIGASFGFGFVFGPAISAFTVGYGEHIPFIIAGVISLISVVLTAIFLPETNKHLGEVKKGKLFNFGKLFEAVTYENIGLILVISLLSSVSFSMYTFAFQPFSVEVLHLKTNFIAIMFTMIGIIGLITQILLLARVTKKFGEIKVINIALILTTALFVVIFFIRDIYQYLTIVVLISFSSSFVSPLVQTLLSKETDEKSQGSIMGLNASYTSIGTTIGPIIGGVLATFFIPLPFIGCSLILFICYLLAVKLHRKIKKKESSF